MAIHESNAVDNNQKQPEPERRMFYIDDVDLPPQMVIDYFEQVINEIQQKQLSQS
jgi:ribosome-binding protein aMBF1 (putative translation factor)